MKIAIIKNVRTPEDIKILADVVQEVMLQKFNAPPRDRYVLLVSRGIDRLCFFLAILALWLVFIQLTPPRYQIITQHEPCEIICEDTNLNYPRTDKLVFIQIFQQGRDAKLKRAVYAELQERLEQDCGVPGTDLIITCSANTKEDWSFGLGRAQFLTGDL